MSRRGTTPPGTYISPAESGLYYLNSRYYDPETGRFVNADGYVSTGQGVLGNNMFACCNNNPVNYCDPLGNMAWVAFLKFLGSLAAGWLIDGIAESVTGYGMGHWFSECMNWFKKEIKRHYENQDTSSPDTPPDDYGIIPDGSDSYNYREKEMEYYEKRYGFIPDVPGYEPSLQDLINYGVIPNGRNYSITPDGTRIVWDQSFEV